jgi:DNA-directed RNA polymerase alpha subunit
MDYTNDEESQTRLIWLLKQPIGALEMSAISYTNLYDADIRTIGQLVQYQEAELLKLPRFRRSNLNEIKKLLEIVSISLGMELNKKVRAAITQP